jgi:hypothetical protein
MKTQNIFLLIAGLLSLGVAAFQAVISFVPAWSAYFGGGEALVSNPTTLLVAGLVVTLLFALAGLYGLSGAGVIRRLPLLRTGLIVVTLVYIYRGSLFIPQYMIMIGRLSSPVPIPLQYTISSLVALVIGVFYLVGLVTGWKRLSPKKAVPASDSSPA